MVNNLIDWEDFTKIEMKVGTILKAEIFKEAIKPAYKLTIDFGEFGIKKSSAQITKNYQPNDLMNKQIIAIVNFPPKQIANFISECLVLGCVSLDNQVILLKPDFETSNGISVL